MLKKPNRASTHDLLITLKKGTTRNSGHFSIRKLANNHKESRISCVVSKKVAKTAVARNTLKRRMRALLREMVPKSGVYIVYAKKDASLLSGGEIRAELKALLKV